MQVYEAPLRDMRFVLHELFADDDCGDVEALAEFTPDLYDAILDEADKLAREVLFPINVSGDAEGCTFENGVVRTPAGFKEAYAVYCDGGWPGLVCDPDWGGQGLPERLNKLIEEITSAANLSFSLYPGLTLGATAALDGHATDDLKQTYLPKMVSGEWSGTMCLTEAHCGSDLGLLRTRATPDRDGSYKVTGSKIFISAGDHDLTSNIVHLVLARLPDAPAGVKGISLFLVPKYLLKGDGSLGSANAVSVAAIEHKMGMRASATCQLNFDGSTGWLVGEPHRGLAAMFTMMNTERVSVGMQGLGIAELAYQSAVAYAKDRIQGRALSGAKRPDLVADPIIVHPDVRRMLMTMRVSAEGCRALGQLTSRALDAEKYSEDPEIRRQAADFVALMTPVVKALFTDAGSESANLCVQIYGGHGFIRDHEVEQLVRDVRITQLYEGTNGIQALDLVGRKLSVDNGRLLRPFLQTIGDLCDRYECADDAQLSTYAKVLKRALTALGTVTQTVAVRSAQDPEEAGAAATDYLQMLGLVAMGYTFLKAAWVARTRLDEGSSEADFYEAKLVTAGFFFERVLSRVYTAQANIEAGKTSMMALKEAAF